MEATISSNQLIKEQDIDKLSYLCQIIEKTYELPNEETKESIKDNREELREEDEFDVYDVVFIDYWEGGGKKKRFLYIDLFEMEI